jgi:hypothetical protein
MAPVTPPGGPVSIKITFDERTRLLQMAEYGARRLHTRQVAGDKELAHDPHTCRDTDRLRELLEVLITRNCELFRTVQEVREAQKANVKKELAAVVKLSQEAAKDWDAREGCSNPEELDAYYHEADVKDQPERNKRILADENDVFNQD